MPLQPPRKTAAGYFLSLTPPVQAPRLRWDTTSWTVTSEWAAWAQTTRQELLGELLSHGNWFSRPPRRELLDPLFSPWVGRNGQGADQLFCKGPEAPGDHPGTAAWVLQGLLMSSTSIIPVWATEEYVPDEEQDTISLFGDAQTADGSEGETREILLDEIEAAPASSPTKIRNREWEARKFIAKDRVREARLKAQIAIRMARKEEARFFAHFGDLEEDESQFSDYDLTDEEDSEVSTTSESLA